MRALPIVLLVTLGVAPASRAPAQAAPGAAIRLGPVERRPRLAADADTNDAGAYFAHASRLLGENPSEAATAFYWAARLDPSSAEALDGRRVSMLMRKYPLLKMYMEGGRRARQNKDLKSLDSLAMRAVRLDPLYYRKYDLPALMEYYRSMLRQDYPNASAADINGAIRDYLQGGSPYMRGWVAYSEGRLGDALTAYADAMKRVKNKGFLLTETARVLALQGLLPSANDRFREAAVELAKVEEDRDEDVVFYNDRALVEHSRGVIFAKLGQADSARAALGRAITEDLSYFMAHVELGRLAITQHDTATAVAELGLAAELAADEPWVHYLHGSTLVAAGQHADAVAPLRKAITLEPLYAAPYFSLGQALERTGDTEAARQAYLGYLQRSPRREIQSRQQANERAASLAP
ncbi:MAG: tetratricopeptide repeat protein [Gemmatimonadaceae bacterium]|nr:tetratricopeptide repeat protein [Gemmatimonadaceae bacterium]